MVALMAVVMGGPSRKPLGNNQVQSMAVVMDGPSSMFDKVHRAQKIQKFSGLGVSLILKSPNTMSLS